MPHTHDIEVLDDAVRKVFVSWADHEPEREWAALAHLQHHAPDLAPAPISQDVVGGRPAVTMSRVAGNPLRGPLSPAQAHALATAVRRLFAVPVPSGLRARANDPAGLERRFRPWLAEEYAWGLCADPALVRHAVEVARGWLEGHPPAGDWVVDPVVALGDGNLDNVLWDGEVCRLIDWEEYGASDLAYEVADLVEHASSRLARHLDVPALIDALALDEAQRERLDDHRRRLACFWLAMLLPGNGGWHRNPRGSTEDQARHVLDLVHAEAG